MKIVEQWIVGNTLILKTENGKYYFDAGRGYYEEMSEEKAKERIKKY